MLAYPKNVSFWHAHKLHMGVAVLVLILHAGLFYALWRARAGNLPVTEPVFVRVIHDSYPSGPVSRETAKTRSDAKQSSTHMQAISSIPIRAPAPVPAVSSIEISVPVPAPVTAPVMAPVTAPAEISAPASSASVGVTQATMTAQTKVPVGVISDVSLACPVRAAPVYPLTARKLGETGKVVLRVELDETGRLVASDVAGSSGFPRLDEAAQAAVKSWRCHPAMRDGQALRIVSMESFDFRLDD